MSADKQNLLYEKVLGCLWGLTVGDALGQPSRGLSWRGVRERLGRVSGFQPWPLDVDETKQHSPGQMGDLACMAAQFAARAGRISAKPRASVLIDELFTSELPDSLPTRAALARIRAGIEPSRSAVPELAGSEGIYLAVPIGIANIGDPEGAFLSARSVVGPILLGPSLEAGQVFAAAIATALMPNKSPKDALDAALDIAPPSVAALLQPAVIFAKEHLGHPPALLMPNIHDRLAPKSSGDTHGGVLESLAVAMALVYLNDGYVEQSTLSAAAYGGWAHTTAAAAGALSGALCGAPKVPKEWIRTVASANPSFNIPEIAEGLCGIINTECKSLSARLEQLTYMSQSHAAAA